MPLRRTLAFVLCMVMSSCSFTGVAFRKDHRLKIVNLPDRSTIEIPFDLRFTFDGTLSPDGATAFGILIDWTPPPPGAPLARLLENDPACQGAKGCPDGYLEQNRIITTTDTTFVMNNVPIGTDRQERRGFHEVTIVLVDAQGRRVGETAVFTRFRTPGVNA